MVSPGVGMMIPIIISPLLREWIQRTPQIRDTMDILAIRPVKRGWTGM